MHILWRGFCPTMSDNRLEVHFGVSVPAIELDTAAASEQLLPESSFRWTVFCRLGNLEPRKIGSCTTCTSPHWTCHRTASRSDKSCGTSWCSTWCTNQVIQQDFQVLQNIKIDNKRCTCTMVGPCLGRGQADPWEQEHYRQTSCISPTLPKRQTLCTEPILPEFQAQSWRWGINECHQETINLNLFQVKMSVLSEKIWPCSAVLLSRLPRLARTWWWFPQPGDDVQHFFLNI